MNSETKKEYITYPQPKNYKILSYQEVRDRIKSFESSECSGIFVFDGLTSSGKNLMDIDLHMVFIILSNKCGENYLFVERIQ